MPRRCKICEHPKRTQIDKALVSGKSYRGVALQFKASPQAVYRHKKHLQILHVSEQIQKQTKHIGRQRIQAEALYLKIEGLLAQAEAITTKFIENDDNKAALTGIRESSRLIEILLNAFQSSDAIAATKPYPELKITIMPESKEPKNGEE